MSLQIVGTDSIGNGDRVDLGVTNDAFVARGVVVGSTDGVGIAGNGNGHFVDVEGTVVGATGAIALGAAYANSGQHVLIGEGAYAAVTSSGHAAVQIRGHNSLVENHGVIHGESYGVSIGGTGTTTSVITNSGVIEGGTHAVFHALSSTDTIELHNVGVVRATSQNGYAYYDSTGTTASDKITNSNLMVGGIFLGAGHDEYDGRSGRVENGSVTGGDGSDWLLGGAYFDDLLGDAGDDTILGGGGADNLLGGAGDDHFGEAGDDFLSGDGGNNLMFGGQGNDDYRVESAGDIVDENGTGGIDRVNVGLSFSLSDTAHVKGMIEDLSIFAAGTINGTGNALANMMRGHTGNNTLNGLAGNDTLDGMGGADTLVGGLGNDTLAGGDGADKLYGGLGNDVLTGGSGADGFVFHTAPNATVNRDMITDFTHGLDKFQLENAAFRALGAAGNLTAGFFFAGTTAHDTNDHVIYNQATGVLAYDADGNGGLPAVQFGVLTNEPTLAAADFVVI